MIKLIDLPTHIYFDNTKKAYYNYDSINTVRLLIPATQLQRYYEIGLQDAKGVFYKLNIKGHIARRKQQKILQLNESRKNAR